MTERRLRTAQIVLALVGLASASWLTYTKYEHADQCGFSGCEVVQKSPWSELYGIPVSLLGMIGYVGILALLFLPRQRNELVRLALVVTTGIGFLFSMFLMYRAYITLEAFCPFCTVSAIVMTLLAIISVTRFLRGPGVLTPAGPVAEDEDATGLDDEPAAPAGAS
jgi:uncharacterized membrane protein